ncbi:MAG: NAD-dependent dehydratase, partial [Pseudomonadota bacterium]
QDSVRCIELALKNPPKRGDKVAIFNQMTETHRVRDLAKIVADMTRAEILNVPNPRKEADENELIVRNDQFLQLGLKPITLAEGLLREVIDVAEKYAHRIDRSRIPAVSAWTKDIAKRVVHEPAKRDLKVVGAE